MLSIGNPSLFSLSLLLLGLTAKYDDFHSYADDIQLYL